MGTIKTIYHLPIDTWFTQTFLPSFNQGEVNHQNPAYRKMLKMHGKVVDRSINPTKPEMFQSYKRSHFLRYENNFLLAIQGSKDSKHCIQCLETFIREVPENTFWDACIDHKHQLEDVNFFLGHKIRTTPKRKLPLRRNALGKLSYYRPHTVLDAPTREILSELCLQVMSLNKGTSAEYKIIEPFPHRIVQHYRALEDNLLDFYRLATNFSRFASRIQYLLRYSCVLTLASKMKLRTKRKVFKRFGKQLSIRDPISNTCISYPQGVVHGKRRELKRRENEVFHFHSLAQLVDTCIRAGR